ncbi:hypothetical protein LJN55_22675 [Erwinia rhapontici]|uniref:hypothetical protein n=1 Tax=Erwinia rhapontici TaxID=55212 RepID=UPI001D0D88E0|nr:hypothetical protein [Erwinia rhapontici]UDQ80165.1 hypothetical protein LJN55_22675 [Erwinia rhapontici]
MKVYDTNYPPDTFGRIKMGLIKEMYLSYSGYSKPVGGDSLRISCTYQGVVRDVITVKIVSAADSSDAPETVLIRVEGRLADMGKLTGCDNGWFHRDHLPRLQS